MTVPAVKFDQLPETERKELLAGVMQRYEHDDTIADLAREQGCSTTTLYRRLLRECPEEWRAVQSARAVKQLEAAKESLEGAKDNVEVNRAGKQIQTAQWELERLHARLYGQQEASLTSAIQINVNIAPRNPVPDSERGTE